MLGLDRSAIGTLVERSSRFTMLLHLPPPADRNRPAPSAGRRCLGMVLRRFATRSPARSRRCQNSCAGHWGGEMAQHAQLRINIGLPVYFCDPQNPWQHGLAESPGH
jgi:IS30 family transposase